MANSYTIIQGQAGLITPASTIVDTGWVVDGTSASHGACNPGTMTALNAFGLTVGRAYVFKYTVSNLTSGGVKLIAGTANGTNRTANGTYTETLTMATNDFLSFYSDGSLTIGKLSFYDLLLGPISGRTITFNEKENHWTQEWSYTFDRMVKFVTKLFAFQNGTIWQQNVNPVQNTFFGVKYPAQVVFIVNKDYAKNKLWYNMRLDSTGKWYAPTIQTPPDDLFPNGMETVLTSNNIKSIDGKLWADMLRDVTDPNFAYIADPGLRAANALFRGRMMQGGWLIVTLQNDDITPATLSSAEFFYVDVEKTLKP